MVPAVRGLEAFFRVHVSSQFSGKQTIVAAIPPFCNSPWKLVNPSPCIQSPIIRVPPLSSNIPSLALEFSQGIFRSEVLGFGEQTLAVHNLEILYQLLQFLVIRRNCRYEGFEWDRDGFSPILCPCFRHFSPFSQPLSHLRNFLLRAFSLPLIATESRQANCR